MDFIGIDKLVKRYPSTGQVALHDVSLRVPRGSLFGLLGPNGAGKSTLLSILLGLLPRTSGKVVIGGFDLGTETAAIRRITGLVPQELAFYPALTVTENLTLFAGLLSLSRAERENRISFVVDAADLREFLDQPAGACSGGQQRRLNLALGLLGKPELLCLDEPTVGIDPHSRQYILDVIRRLNADGVTVIYTSHYLSEVQQLCTRLAVLDHGRVIAEGKTADLLSTGTADIVDAELDGPIAASRLVAMPGFIGAHENRVRFAQQDPDAALRALLEIAQAEGRRLVSLRPRAVSLEQLYLQLTEQAGKN